MSSRESRSKFRILLHGKLSIDVCKKKNKQLIDIVADTAVRCIPNFSYRILQNLFYLRSLTAKKMLGTQLVFV